jgi:heme exporter protein A
MPSHDGSSLLDVRGLRRTFGRARILNGLDLTLHAGEVLAVAGPNGAGKTTLLRLLAGLMRPSAGDIRVLGQRLTHASAPVRRAIGLLSHQSLLYDDLTLRENLIFTARLYALDRPDVVVREALEAAGLSDRANDLPPKLSRGLLQRAAIARATLHRPSLLLLDEPFTALDATASDRLRADLRARVLAGAALLIVTHHLEEAWELATRVAVLVQGRWVAEEAREGPLDAFLPRYHRLLGA